jgi:sulfur carrier protein
MQQFAHHGKTFASLCDDKSHEGCYSLMMRLLINGIERELGGVAERLQDLVVRHLGLTPDRIAVELNREIVPRGKWSETELRDGDKLEIVHFVGGGLAS